ncbi:MAG: DUF4271 domain-containing protein [Salinivirgaceae bacterium]|nr:DUF4271 domain-containing protein [Salinivirgaceae bacterium]
MSFSQVNGLQSDTTAIQVVPASSSSVMMSRQTLDFGGADAFRVDSSRLEPKKTYTPVVKTVPFVPVDDTVEHPAYDVLTGDFIINHDGSIASQLKINPILPVSDSAPQSRIVAVEPPKTQQKHTAQQISVSETPASIVLVQADAEPSTETVAVTDSATATADTAMVFAADTTEVDSLALRAQKVFTEKEGKPIQRKTDNILLNKSVTDTDWMIGVVILAGLIFAWTRMIYGKYIGMLMQSAVNFFTARRVYEESNVVRGRVYLLLNILFFINIGMFTNQCAHLYGFSLEDTSGFVQFCIFSLAFLAFYLAKTIVLKILDFIFDTHAFGAYSFTIHLYNKVYGLFLLPLIAVIPFVPENLAEKLVWAGLALFVLFYIFTLFRGLRICIKNRVSIFYLFFYLCALEILPLLTIYKFLTEYV